MDPRMLSLDTHKEGERTDSVSPPQYGLSNTYPVNIPHGTPGDRVGWGASGSVPSAIAGSFGATTEEVLAR
jgi:hypothetical protein